MLVIANKPGFLGNRLIVGAHCAAFAMEHRQVVLNPSFDEYAPYFPNVEKDILGGLPPRLRPCPRFLQRLVRSAQFHFWYYLAAILVRIRPQTRLWKVIHLDWTEPLDLDSAEVVEELTSAPVVVVKGWLIRAESSIQKHRDSVRSIFQPHDWSVQRADAKIQEARAGGLEIVVGVHLRLGDYGRLFDGRFLYSPSRYAELMSRVEEGPLHDQRVAFVVCSNEPLVPDDFGSVRSRIVFGDGHELVDLQTLASCDLLVGPPSTYSMWASFYGDAPLYKVESIDDTPQLEDFKVFDMRGWPNDVRTAGPTYW